MIRRYFLLCLILFGLFLSLPAHVFAAVNWTETQPAGDTNYNWQSVSMSGDGQLMLVGAYPGRLYVSKNGGSTWSEVTYAGNIDYNWNITEVNNGGSLIAAGAYGGYFIGSLDQGDNWGVIAGLGDPANWASASIGSTNNVLVGIENSLLLYLNPSASFSQPFNTDPYAWKKTSLSRNGIIGLAAVSPGRLFKSIDSGANFVEIQPAGNTDFTWSTLSTDENGQNMLAGVSGGKLYVSYNSGTNWVETQPVGNQNLTWTDSAMSVDGETMLVGAQSGDGLYLTIDGGSSWEDVSPPGVTGGTWDGVALSGDGKTLLAGDKGGRLYLGQYVEPTPTPTPNPASNGGGSSAQVRSTTETPVCGDTAPLTTPELFQINVTNSKATLYFSPVLGANKYYIGYGLGTNARQFGVEYETGQMLGVSSYTINNLSPNTTYSFITRGGNGCMPGGWGNTMKIKTGTSTKANSFYKSLAR